MGHRTEGRLPAEKTSDWLISTEPHSSSCDTDMKCWWDDREAIVLCSLPVRPVPDRTKTHTIWPSQ